MGFEGDLLFNRGRMAGSVKQQIYLKITHYETNIPCYYRSCRIGKL